MKNKEFDPTNTVHSKLALDFGYLRRRLTHNVIISNAEIRKSNAIKNKQDMNELLGRFDNAGSRLLLHEVAEAYNESEGYNGFKNDYTSKKQVTSDWLDHLKTNNVPSIDEGIPYPYKNNRGQEVDIKENEIVLVGGY